MGIPQYNLYMAGGGIKTATVAGTAIALAGTTACCGVVITTISTVTGIIAIGNSTCYASGGSLGSGVNAGSTPFMYYAKDLGNVYVSCSVSATTEAVRYIYYLASEN
jgi:hypothetical protein